MFLSSLAVLVIAVGLSGCGGEGASDQPAPAAGQPEATGGDEHAGHAHGEDEHAGHMPASTEVAEALAELPLEDQAAAEKQRICPVQEAALGSMGKPVKVSVRGRDVFLCCEWCREAIIKDPDKYLAKLNQ
jgi:hypothetical protein